VAAAAVASDARPISN